MTDTTGDLPAPAEVETTVTVEADAKTEQTEATGSAPVPKVDTGKDSVQKRIDKLTWEKNELARRLQALESNRAKPEPKPELKAPTLEESGYDEAAHRDAMTKYWESLVDQKATEAAKKMLEERDKEEKARDRDSKFNERLSKLSEDEKEHAFSAIATEFTANIIKESEFGIEILKHLADNTQFADNLAKLPDFVQARELGRLEARFEAQKSAPVQSPVVSKAPPPAPKIEAASAPVEKDLETASDNEWYKAKLKERNKRR